MIKRNLDLKKLHADYLFVEIDRRKQAVLQENPQAEIINLGIGDTTEPIPSPIVEALQQQALALGTREGYLGYGYGTGREDLRKKIAEKVYQGAVPYEDIFISDGAKCDIGRLQMLFDRKSIIAVQDPTYPAYVSSSVIAGKTDAYDVAKGQYAKVVYMPCLPQNRFFPDLDKIDEVDVIYFCSPNNPTGSVPTKEELKRLIDFAKDKNACIIFDSAYSSFIQDPELPKSIYEIEGAQEVAIESGSFSKHAGFTGVRLGWSVVPHQLQFSDSKTSVREDWIRIISSYYNGASNIAQEGGMAALSDEGLHALEQIIGYYLENAKLLKNSFQQMGYPCYGGDNAPYIWVDLKGKKSWDIFEDILQKAHVVTTPGSGFGPSGEGFLRLSSFGKREDISKAVTRIKEVFSGTVAS